MKARWLLAAPALVLALGLALAACGGGSGDAPEKHGNEVWERESSLASAPSFLDDFSARTRHLYGVVGDYRDIMQQITCYCGCSDMGKDSHKSLYRCYIAEEREDGVTWTDHAAFCGICLDQLQYIEQWSREGKTPDKIRQLMKEKYEPAAQA